MISGVNRMHRKLDILEQNTSKDGELVRFRILKLHASHAGIDLRFLPSVFERHRKNISFFFLKERTIYWMVSVSIVIETQNKILEFVTDPLSENTPLNDVLSLIPADDTRVQTFFDLPYNLSMAEKLQKAKLSAFLKVKEKEKTSTFKLIDLNSSLREALRDSCFYEFPEIFIALYHSRNTISQDLSSFKVETLTKS